MQPNSRNLKIWKTMGTEVNGSIFGKNINGEVVFEKYFHSLSIQT